MNVTSFFDPDTFSYTHVVWDAASREAAIIDSVYDFDPAAGRVSPRSAAALIAHVDAECLDVRWHLETHVHADHLSAARYLKRRLGGDICMGRGVVAVQANFSGLFNAEAAFRVDGSQFDRLLDDGDVLPLGEGSIRVMATPGHTPGCVTYLVDDMAFVGDTLFMPDFGTARTDFPGGDAAVLYRSLQRILALPDETRLFMCHDYGSATRSEFSCETTVRAQREENVHLTRYPSEHAFCQFRRERDAELSAPKLLFPAVQFNMRGGALPPCESNGRAYMKIPVSLAS